jgi:hypothetical protein
MEGARRIRGFVGYCVSDSGDVWNIKTGKLLKPSISCSSYAYVCIKSTAGTFRRCFVHRLVAQTYVINPRPDIFLQVDHIDQNPLNNHRSNLRWLSRQLNLLNSSALGCRFNKGFRKWHAQLCVSGKKTHLGYYKTFLEGHRAYMAARTAAFDQIYTKLVSEGPRNVEFLP